MSFLEYAAYHTPSRLLFRFAGTGILLLAAGYGLSHASHPGASSHTQLLSVRGGDPIEVCFVPGDDCGALVAREIDEARSSIRVQAYTFTSPRIAHALGRARRRGVDVLALLDEREARRPNEAAAIRTLVQAGVGLRLDGAHSTAHNKVLVIDEETVVTGSFNFSVSAERYSAENVLVLRGQPRLVRAYSDNWARHWIHGHS
jgi:phosphatidylserine/phosphatidylglycerophosphate/cardiolipin synthase-like enzyme